MSNTDEALSLLMGRLCIVALMLATIAAVLGSGGTYDTVRDIFQARQIATGAEFPVVGPPIGGVFHLGPVWYWVLAPGWWLGGMAGVVSLMGLLCALKFPLAWHIGRRLRGHQGGWFALAGIAWPGWSFYETALLTHVAVVQTTLLATLLCAMRLRARAGGLDAAGLGLAAGLCVQAHPSSLLLAAAILCWGLGPVVRPVHPGMVSARAVKVAIAFGTTTLPMLPYALAQWVDGFPDQQRIADHGRSMFAHEVAARLPRLVDAALRGGFEHVAGIAWGLRGPVSDAVAALATVIVGALAFGLLRGLRDAPLARAMTAAAIGCFVAHAVFLLVIRDITPVWMMFGFGVPLAGLVALGLDGLRRGGWSRRLAAPIVACVLVGQIAASIAPLVRGTDEVLLPRTLAGRLGLMDVVEPFEGVQRIESARLDWRSLAAIGEPLCHPVVVHGHYANAVELTHTVALAAACGDHAQVQIGGAPTGRPAWLGLAAPTVERLRLSPPHWIGSLAVFDRYRVAHAAQGLAPVEPRTHGARRLAGEVVEVTWEVETQPGDVVILSHLAPGYFPFDVQPALRGGRTVAPAYRDASLAAFRCEECADGERIAWQLRAVAVREQVDVIVLSSGGVHGPHAARP